MNANQTIASAPLPTSLIKLYLFKVFPNKSKLSWDSLEEFVWASELSEEVSELLDCKKSTLQRWIERYLEYGNVDRKENKERESIITKSILKYITKLISKNPAIILAKIKKKIIKKFNVDISVSYLFYIIKYTLNLTHKQLRFKYYPEKKLATLREDKINFYKEIIKKGKKNIISIDETGFYLNMTKHLGRCEKGRKCYKTVHFSKNYSFY